MACEEYLSEEDIEGLRKSWEISDHWELRRQFLLAHREQFPRGRLLSLAQMFVNIETLKTRYDTEMMELVENLSRDVSFLDSFREKKASLGGTKFAAPKKPKEDAQRGFSGSNWNAHGRQSHGSSRDSSFSSTSSSSSPTHFRQGSGFRSEGNSPSGYSPASRQSYSSPGSAGGYAGQSSYEPTGYGPQYTSWTAGNSSVASYETASYQTSNYSHNSGSASQRQKKPRTH